MNLKQILKKQITESGRNPREWNLEDQLIDTHQARLELRDMAMKYQSDDNVHLVQTEALTGQNRTITRSQKHGEIKHIKYHYGTGDYKDVLERIDHTQDDTARMGYDYDRDNIYFYNTYDMNVVITYEVAELTEWTVADITPNTAVTYTDITTANQVPDELEEVHHRLLWLIPAIRNATPEKFQMLNNWYAQALEDYKVSLQREVEFAGYVGADNDDDWHNCK